MTTVYDVPADRFIRTLAEELKKRPEMKPPDWAAFAKTGVHKQMPPTDPEWWFVRAASILRRVYIEGPIGVQRNAARYTGVRRDRAPNRTVQEGSGSILRKALQQLENAGLIQKDKAGRRGEPEWDILYGQPGVTG